jgi:hypothetical protein
MGLSISDDQFMINISNNLTLDYELQFVLMERRIENVEKPLMHKEIQKRIESWL